MYDLYRQHDGQVIAHGHTDWIFLESDTLRPAAIPQEIIEAFFPDGLPEERPVREPFPQAPPPPSGTFTLRRRVGWRDIDPVQHVNNANYMIYVEDAGVQACAARGWPITRMMEVGFGIVARRYRIEHRQPAVFGDELEIATWASDMKRATAWQP